MPHSNGGESLLRTRRFAPLFWAQFLGAFNDNAFKNALMFLIAFQSGPILGLAPEIMVQVATGLFILPFFLFSAMAGQLADKYDKAWLARWVKLLEIGIALVAAVGFTFHLPLLLIFGLVLMGLHSTFFAPIKYAILPQLLHEEELVAGNAWVESGTFIAILAGTIFTGAVMALKPQGPMLAGISCVVLALLGYWASRFIPSRAPAAPDLVIDRNPLRQTLVNLRLARQNPAVFHALMGISWFWFFGALFLSLFAPFVKSVLGGTELLVTALLAMFIIGIAFGSFLCERWSGKHLEIGLVPFGSIGLTVFGTYLWWACPTTAQHYPSVAAFFAERSNWHLVFALVMIGVAGGFYTVPLYAMIQLRTEPASRSRIIAANNILNAAFMVASAALVALALALGASIAQIFLIAALMNIAVAIYVYKLVPEFLLRFVTWLLVHSVYHLKTRGVEHIPAEGPAIVVCNHVSYVDALILTAASRRPIRFVMDHRIFKVPLANFIFRAMRTIPIASAKEDPQVLEAAYEEIAAALAAGELIGLFPEGALTGTGEMGAFKNGISRILERTPVPVVPMALRGLWDSAFARKPGSSLLRLVRRGVWSKVELVAESAWDPASVTPDTLRAQILGMRGDWR